MFEDPDASHGTEKTKVRLTPAPKIRKKMELQLINKEERLRRPHHPERVLKILGKLDHFPLYETMLEHAHERLNVDRVVLSERRCPENDRILMNHQFTKHRQSPRLCTPEFKISQMLPQNSLGFHDVRKGKHNLGNTRLCWSHQQGICTLKTLY